MTLPAERLRTFTVETLTDSQQVYASVIKEALDYSVLGEGNGSRAHEFYDEMGVVRVPLNRYSDGELGKHRGYDADQSVQPTAAYKDRAAVGAVLATEPGKHKGHVASAGNAGAAYVRAASKRGMRTTVHCGRTASSAKLERILEYGGEVNATYNDLEAAQDGAELASVESDGALYHPFDRDAVLKGNATAGFEMIADLLSEHAKGEVDVFKDPVKLFVPVGGGGLIAGVAIAVKWAKEQGYVGEDNVQVVGVQMEGCDAMKRTVDCLRADQQPPEDLFANGLPFNANSDGTAVRKPGQLTTAIVADPAFVAGIMLVPEGALGWKMRRQHDRTGKKYEPAGMLARTAAEMYAQAHPDESEVLVSVTSGANVSDELFAKMTKAGLDYKLNQWSSQRKQDRTRDAQRAALAALGNTGLRLSRGDYGKAPEPIAVRQSTNRGAVLSGTFPRF